MYGYQAAPALAFPGYTGIQSFPLQGMPVVSAPVQLASVGEPYMASGQYAPQAAPTFQHQQAEGFVIKRSIIPKGVTVGLGLTLDANLKVQS
jgi:hypothetical protein